MATGISLHIGLNAVDPKKYDGWDGKLAACEFDAKDMLAIAKREKFASSTIMLTKKATSAAVIKAIDAAAKKLKAGDMFWITYSGHGGQVPDQNNDEADSMDETWVLFDRMLVDDELFALWSKFKAGTRIVVLSDSCHSGSVTRAAMESTRPGTFRLMPLDVNLRVYHSHRKTYDNIQKKTPPAEKTGVNATVILISGCQDEQLSLDGARNGLFTSQLRRVWNSGKFKAPYKRLCDDIVAIMPARQRPNYYVVGSPNAAFEKQRPFTP